MRFDKNRFFLAFITFLFTINTIFSESIRLTSGQILEGKILEESEKVIIFQTSKGTFPIKNRHTRDGETRFKGYYRETARRQKAR